MKKCAILFLLFSISFSGYCQQNNPSPTLTKQDYLTKSKKQKTAAWLLLSGGFVMTAIGTGLALDDATAAVSDAFVTIYSFGMVQQETEDKDNTAVANVLFFGGLAAMLSSIPLFKAAKRNNRKGMNLTFSNQEIPSLQKSSFVYHAIPSLKLKISL